MGLKRFLRDVAPDFSERKIDYFPVLGLIPYCIRRMRDWTFLESIGEKADYYSYQAMASGIVAIAGVYLYLWLSK